MIFVTLGTQDKSFHRLLEQLDLLVDEGILDEEIIVQAGSTNYKSRNMEIIDYIDMRTFDKYIAQCDFMISHGGIGSILAALNNGKKVIAVARLCKYDEHENDHQLEIINKFNEKGHIIGCKDVFEVRDKLALLDDFEPKPYVSNNDHFCQVVSELIEL